MDVRSSDDEPLADAAIAPAELNNGDGPGTPSKRRFGSGARSMHAARAVDATLVAMTKAPIVVFSAR
jgi:hypothetical protein